MGERRLIRSAFSQRLATVVLVATALAWPRHSCADDSELRLAVPAAINNGQQFLFSQQSASGQWKAPGLNHAVGAQSLVLLALISSGVDPEQDNVARGIAWLRDRISKNDPDGTYELSLAIMALAAAGDKTRDYGRVSALAQKLERFQTVNGGWFYGQSKNSYDNSNTQYAMLGLRDAAYFGVPIQPRTWRRSEAHWLEDQVGSIDAASGSGWGYVGKSRVRGSMTVAGIASLAITSMFPHSDAKINRLNCCDDSGPSDVEKAIAAGERWLGRNFSARNHPPNNGANWLLYYLYGVERAGRLTGRRFFGEHDWYREGSRYFVAQQRANGSWVGSGHGDSEPLVGTSFGLLFLSKGLAPNLINKIQYGVDAAKEPVKAETGPWNTHPRDVRNLVDYLTTRPKWPKLLSWQVVDLKKAAATQDVDALLQAPVQVLEGRDSLKLITPAERALLAEYLQQGGFLFIVRNCEDPNFDAAVRSLVADVVPDPGYQLEKLPAGHDVYRAEHVFAENPPTLYGVDFGCRTAIIYAPDDHACRWHAWNRRAKESFAQPVLIDVVNSIQIGANVLSYATGRELFDKLSAPEAVDRDELSVRESPLPVARLRHTGGWDAAPGALRNLMSALTEFGIDAKGPTPTVAATDEGLYRFPLLYTHGRRNFELSDEEVEALAKHLENGGILFADACCGAEAFDKSFREVVERITGESLTRIPEDDELFQLPGGHDITRVRRRQPADAVGEALGARIVEGPPFLEGVKIGDRYAVLYSKYDLSCALERQTTVSCAGYIVEDAVRVATNIVLYAIFQDVSIAPETPDNVQAIPAASELH